MCRGMQTPPAPPPPSPARQVASLLLSGCVVLLSPQILLFCPTPPPPPHPHTATSPTATHTHHRPSADTMGPLCWPPTPHHYHPPRPELGPHRSTSSCRCICHITVFSVLLLVLCGFLCSWVPVGLYALSNPDQLEQKCHFCV